MANKFNCINVKSAILQNYSNSKFVLLQMYMSQENINIPKYLAFLLKTSSLFPEESVLYYSGNYHEPES